MTITDATDHLRRCGLATEHLDLEQIVELVLLDLELDARAATPED